MKNFSLWSVLGVIFLTMSCEPAEDVVLKPQKIDFETETIPSSQPEVLSDNEQVLLEKKKDL